MHIEPINCIKAVLLCRGANPIFRHNFGGPRQQQQGGQAQQGNPIHGLLQLLPVVLILLLTFWSSPSEPVSCLNSILFDLGLTFCPLPENHLTTSFCFVVICAWGFAAAPYSAHDAAVYLCHPLFLK